MSESAPKRRSFLAAYWPLIATLSILIFVIVVLFSMRNPDAPVAVPDAPKNASAPPVMPGDPKAAMARVKKLYAKGYKSFAKLPPAEQEFFDALTKGEGETLYNFGVKKLDEQAAMPKPPIGALSTPPPDFSSATPPPGVK
jgi:hypothetical protein